jgi:integrase
MDTPLKKDLDFKLLNIKKLSPGSIKLYLRNLEKLNDNQPLKNLNFLKNIQEVVDRISEYKDNTKRGYLISICSVLSLDKSSAKKQKLYDEYFKMMMEMNRMLKSDEAKNEKSETQDKNWIEWSEVEKIWDELYTKTKAFMKNKELNEHQYDILLQLTVLSLYVLLPPRRNEYQNMVVMKTVPANAATDRNYYDADRKQMVLNKFKTSKKEGQKIIEVPANLQEILSAYLKFHPLLEGKKLKANTDVPFLVYFDGSPLDKVNSITRILNKVFGRRVGSSMLRHIYLSSKYGDVQEQQKTDAEMMGHSTAQQKDYIKN